MHYGLCESSDYKRCNACIKLSYLTDNLLPRSPRSCAGLRNQADLVTERERWLTTARANQTTGLTNSRAANWAPEVEFSPIRALSRRQMTLPFCC